MILAFPNFDILRLALTAGGIPERVSTASARAAFADDGQTWVEPSVTLAVAAEKELHRLGITSPETAPQPLDHVVACWAQLLPLQRDRRERHDEKSPVLFQLPEERQLAELVSEILRLGNDRQGFRWLVEGEARQALLRVVGPPYYSLLRALDGAGRYGAPAAYREAQSGVWIQLGWRHPLEEHLRPPPGKLLLLRPPRDWSFVEEAPFRDIYEVLDFAAPEPTAAWQDTNLQRRWTVPLRLTRAAMTESAELWVLRGAAAAQVDEFVQNADDQLLSRLAFAVADHAGEQVIVLRVRPSRQPPPVLVLSGVGFRPYLRLPNLFLPIGTRLHPPLRRDVVARLLAGDPRQITWLYPGNEGRFTPETIADTAFRPLHDWVDYVLDQEEQALATWVQAARFDFEPFICRDDQPVHKPEPREPRTKKPRQREEVVQANVETASKEIKKGKRKKLDDAFIEEAVPTRPDEDEQTLRALEKEFLAAAGPLDAHERQELWPQLAKLNRALGQTDTAAICWGHALWEAETPAAWWLKAWYQVEKPSSGSLPTAADLEQIVEQKSPTIGQLRTLVAALVWAGNEPTPPTDWKRLLGKIPRVLEKHEPLLGIRPLWLAWTALHRLTHGDVLALARARDRLLERLYVSGLSADLDLPSFLRFTGSSASERFRLVRDQVLRLLQSIDKWAQRGMMPSVGTRIYVDMMFAYALARLGETTEANKLLARGPTHLETDDPVHRWLIAGFEHRVRQACDGASAGGRLPAALLDKLEPMERLLRYKVDRLREHSRILEPHEKIDPFRRWHGRFADDLSRELTSLFDIEDRNDLLNRLNRLLSGHGKSARGKEAQPRILATALELAPRLGESFADVVLERCEASFEKLREPLELALLLEKGLFLAGHYDRGSDVQKLMARFHALLQESSDTLPVKNLESLLGHSFRSLRKLGLRDDVGHLLTRLTQLIEQNPAFKTPKPGSPASTGQGERQRLLLQVASGWFYFGQENEARPILDQARALLFRNELAPIEQTALACAYVTTLGQAPIDLTLARVLELFRKLEGVHDTYTTHSHFSLSRLNVVEATLLALVSDDFTIAPEARRLLDDDEYLVRRRIHRDVRKAMESHH